MAALITWDQRPRYTAVPQINTVSLALSTISAAIAAESNWWEVSDATATHVEIRRKAAPSGDLASARILLFGGASPLAGNLNPGVSANATYLYAMTAIDAGASLVAEPDAGTPYPGATRLLNLCVVTTSFLANIGAHIHIIESPETLVLLGGASGVASAWSVTLGKCVVDEGDTERWAIIPSAAAVGNTDFSSGSSVNWFVPDHGGSTLLHNRGWAEIDSIGTIRACGRALVPARNYSLSSRSQLDSGNNAYLIPVYLSRCRTYFTVSGSDFWEFAGNMRQMKFGPRATLGQILTVAAVPKAYAIAGEGECTHPIWATVDA